MNNRCLARALVLALAATACDPPKARPPEPAALDATASAAPTASPPPSATPDAPTDARSIKVLVGAVATIEVTAGGKESKRLTTQADVDALLASIGTDQIPVKAPLRRCPDQWVIALRDAQGATKGSVGLCTAETLAPELFAPGVNRMPIALADEATLRRLLSIEAPSGGASKPGAAPPAKR